MNTLFGKKLGMTRLFGEDGSAIPVTLLLTGPNTIVQIKTKDIDGYNALQVGFGEKNEKACTKPILGSFHKAKVAAMARLAEIRVESTKNFDVGQVLGADIFKAGDKVDVTGVSKGLGFQGTVRRYGFKGGPKTHGQSDRWRAPGSIGQSSYPSRVFKGMHMAGRMGGRQTTVKNLTVFMVDAENNIIAVKGAVPGKRNCFIRIRKK